MKILGIETTCDDTSVAIVEDGIKILACQVASQQKAHEVYEGVVPEVAARMHLELLLPTMHAVLKESSTSLQELSAVAVAASPGLMGALLIGVHSAKALAYALGIPFLPVNHLLAHLYSVTMACEKKVRLNKKLLFPQLVLLASGGHTLVAHVKSPGGTNVLASTSDDAAGECFDKVGKYLKLGFPGGPAVEKLAKVGNSMSYKFPTSPQKKGEPLSFTFSGLKTAVVHHAEKYKLAYEQNDTGLGKQMEINVNNENGSQMSTADAMPNKADIAASFQRAALTQLVEKTMLLAKSTKIKHVGVCGGVACNEVLKKMFEEKLLQVFPQRETILTVPSPMLCSDNAAMIAGLGYYNLTNGVALRVASYNIKVKNDGEEEEGKLMSNFFNFSPSAKKVRSAGPLDNLL